MIHHAKELHLYQVRDMTELEEEEVVLDEAPTELMSTCKNLLQE